MRSSVPFDNKGRAKVLKSLDRELRAVEVEELLTLDGYRLQFESGWGLVRASGTEPKIRIVAEARERSMAEWIMVMLTEKVKRCVA